MGRFIVIGERIHCISPVIKKAMEEMDPEPILKRAKEQLDAGATYLDVNIGPAEKNGPELMQWVVKLLQENFDNVPLCLDTANRHRGRHPGLQPGQGQAHRELRRRGGSH